VAAPTSGRGAGGRRQRIPRPPGARAGEAAPWDRLAPERRQGIGLDRVRGAMGGMGPAQPWPAAPYGRIPAAVLVALFEEKGESRVILTRRSDQLRSHTGEVSFPGGRLDPGEAPVAAALREAGEEIGLAAEAVEILGQLPPLATVSSRSSITPFVGVLTGRPVLKPNPAEVDLIFDVSLTELAADGVHREERWHGPALADRPELAHRAVHFFELPHDTVWGATARILHQFLALVLLGARPEEGA